MLTTRVVPCKSNLQLACDCRVRHEKCRGLLKHVLNPYDNRSDHQFYIVEIVYDFSMMRAARAFKALFSWAYFRMSLFSEGLIIGWNFAFKNGFGLTIK